jgi:hypothetical protein
MGSMSTILVDSVGVIRSALLISGMMLMNFRHERVSKFGTDRRV